MVHRSHLAVDVGDARLKGELVKLWPLSQQVQSSGKRKHFLLWEQAAGLVLRAAVLQDAHGLADKQHARRDSVGDVGRHPRSRNLYVKQCTPLPPR